MECSVCSVGHFLGNHSVLEILRQEGYEIVHIPPDHQEPVTESRPAEEPTAGSTEEPTDVTPTSWVTGSPEAELELQEPENMPGLGEEELPHMLLPDSLSQLEEFGRHKRLRKAHRGHGRPRLFSDLWVRIGDSTTPPSNVRIINGYVTVAPPLTHLEQHRRMEIQPTQRHLTPASSTPPEASSGHATLAHSTLLLGMVLAWISSDLLSS
ncbi:Metalloprotease TIKI2 [Takifugu flavidus]|uniref:Metalloprotease TIKI n=1 Tax=Takifugu flavidus TaxID=433684 RepID=A0A5C6MSP8_9TELE|nr:Metalloprotease TIKI2 [Takifugu flavidus]